MAFAPVAIEHGVVGDLVQHLMSEDVFTHPFERRTSPRQRQLAAGERGQLLGGLRLDGGQRLGPRTPRRRCWLAGGRAFRGRAAVQPSLQHAS